MGNREGVSHDARIGARTAPWQEGKSMKEMVKGLVGGFLFGLMVLVLIAAPSWAAPPLPETVKVGALFDTTGPTSDVGVDYHKGALSRVRYINEVKGGVKGKLKITLVWSDYGYKIPEAVSLYKKFRDVDRVVAIIGWGTGDTEALSKMAAQDKIPYISASYSSHLDDPAKTPYNFYPVASYSDQLRGMLTFFKELADREGIKKPKIVFSYPDHPYGKAPIPAGKALAKELGFEIGPDQIVALTALEAKSQMQAVKNFDADFLWIGGTTASASVTVRDAREVGVKARIGVNVWGYDENMIRLIGKAAEGVYGSTPHRYFGEDRAPGMKTMLDIWKRFEKPSKATFRWGTPETPFIASYVRGWLNVMLLEKALEVIVENWGTYGEKYKGQITGEAIKEALETLRNWDPEGLAPPITLTSTDHRPSTTTRILVIKGGRIVPVKEITVERRPDWLGF